MKNLKKVLALVVALTMVLGTVAFAGYTDVAEDAAEYTAVSTLSSLNILTGYEDGTFKPDGDITRAEFCAVVCRALGASVSGNAVTGFTDVPSDHWASGYIAYAAGQKIVNGMGDGTFAPDANVTYEQAVKMLVVALGFEPMASQKGGYPTGYMVVANTYEMTKGISGVSQSAPASRGVVAELTYNALDIPMMEQTGFGTQTEYTIQDGTNNKAYKTLLTNLDVIKLDGIVKGTHIIECSEGKAEKGEIYYEVSAIYDESDDTYEVGDVPAIKVAEGVNADEYFGMSSTIYVQEVAKSKYEIIAVMPGDDSETVELALEDISGETTDREIYYYPSASSSKTSKYKLDERCEFYYNNKSKTTLLEIIRDDTNDRIYENKDMAITLIENDGDSSFDMVVVKEYDYDRVKAIDVEASEFDSSKANTFEFDFDDEDTSITMVDKDGNDITLDDFAEDDVIAYMSSGDDKEGSDDTADYDWIEIINLGKSCVTGTVDEKKADAIFVDGTEYSYTFKDDLSLGDEGTFYLTLSGKIFDYEKDVSVSGNYAYILETDINTTGFSDAWQVKLLTKNNEIVIYTVRDKFNIRKYNESTKKFESTSCDKDNENVPVLSELRNADNHHTDVAKRVITYKLDSKGYIREITTLANRAEDFDKKEYKEDVQRLGVDVEDNVVIFNIVSESMTSAYTAGLSYLVDEGKYSGYYFENEKGDYDCFVITEGTSLIDVTQDIAIVSNVTKSSLNDNTDEALKVRYYTSGKNEEKEIIVVDNSDVTTLEWGTSLDMIKVGSVFMFADDGNGTATSIGVIAEANAAGDQESKPFTINKKATDAITGLDEDVTFEYGFLDDWEATSKGMKVTNVDGDTFNIKSGANAYTYYNRSSTKVTIEVGSWRKGDVAKEKDGIANAYFTKLYNGSVSDIVSYSTRKDTSKSHIEEKN